MKALPGTLRIVTTWGRPQITETYSAVQSVNSAMLIDTLQMFQSVDISPVLNRNAARIRGVV